MDWRETNHWGTSVQLDRSQPPSAVERNRSNSFVRHSVAEISSLTILYQTPLSISQLECDRRVPQERGVRGILTETPCGTPVLSLLHFWGFKLMTVSTAQSVRPGLDPLSTCPLVPRGTLAFGPASAWLLPVPRWTLP